MRKKTPKSVMFSSPKLTQWNISIWCFGNSLRLLSCKQNVIAVMMGPYKQTPAPSFTSTQILTTGLFSSLVFMKLDELQLYLMGKLKTHFNFIEEIEWNAGYWFDSCSQCFVVLISCQLYMAMPVRQLFEKNKKQLSCFFRLV